MKLYIDNVETGDMVEFLPHFDVLAVLPPDSHYHLATLFLRHCPNSILILMRTMQSGYYSVGRKQFTRGIPKVEDDY